MPLDEYRFCRRSLLEHLTVLRRSRRSQRQIEVTQIALKGIRQQFYRKGVMG